MELHPALPPSPDSRIRRELAKSARGGPRRSCWPPHHKAVSTRCHQASPWTRPKGLHTSHATGLRSASQALFRQSRQFAPSVRKCRKRGGSPASLPAIWPPVSPSGIAMRLRGASRSLTNCSPRLPQATRSADEAFIPSRRPCRKNAPIAIPGIGKSCMRAIGLAMGDRVERIDSGSDFAGRRNPHLERLVRHLRERLREGLSAAGDESRLRLKRRAHGRANLSARLGRRGARGERAGSGVLAAVRKREPGRVHERPCAGWKAC